MWPTYNSVERWEPSGLTEILHSIEKRQYYGYDFVTIKFTGWETIILRRARMHQLYRAPFDVLPMWTRYMTGYDCIYLYLCNVSYSLHSASCEFIACALTMLRIVPYNASPAIIRSELSDSDETLIYISNLYFY